MTNAPESPAHTAEHHLEQELHALLLTTLGQLPPESTLILDQPLGHALDLLTRADPAHRSRTLIVTSSRSPEYIEDLWTFRPGLLVTNPPSVQDLANLIRNTAGHGPVRHTPGVASRLTSSERLLLQGVSHGHSNKVIANTLGLSDRTVHNTLTRIFQKLGVTNRLEAALQYWSCSDRRWPTRATTALGLTE